jgi:hypothetical protein
MLSDVRLEIAEALALQGTGEPPVAMHVAVARVAPAAMAPVAPVGPAASNARSVAPAKVERGASGLLPAPAVARRSSRSPLARCVTHLRARAWRILDFVLHALRRRTESEISV